MMNGISIQTSPDGKVTIEISPEVAQLVKSSLDTIQKLDGFNPDSLVSFIKTFEAENRCREAERRAYGTKGKGVHARNNDAPEARGL